MSSRHTILLIALVAIGALAADAGAQLSPPGRTPIVPDGAGEILPPRSWGNSVYDVHVLGSFALHERMAARTSPVEGRQPPVALRTFFHSNLPRRRISRTLS